MRISWNILRTLLNTGDLTPKAAADVLTGTGLEVEHVELFEPVPGMLAGVVVGQVLTCAPHPDADRLRVCSVDVGAAEALGIVCGAPNVAEGQKVLVATVGAVLRMADGSELRIKRSKIRGVESNGMICAADELGLPGGHDGIMVLDPAAVVGTPAAEQLGLRSDHVLEIGLTPNRSDALRHYGVARDLHAACRTRGVADTAMLPVDAPEPAVPAGRTGIAVQVDAPDAAPRYAGVLLEDLRVGPSPAWLVEALQALGLRSVNNVVDITNYVQHELGQPLHAFDAASLRDGRIVVRRAHAGENFVALDGRKLTLDVSDLVIADGQGAVCLAGIFGGKDSGVTEHTTSVFLESACFDATTVRRSARRHGLHTDASFRYERGVDPAAVLRTMRRAVKLLQDVAGAQVAGPEVDVDAGTWRPASVRLRHAYLERLTGVSMAATEVEEALRLLGFGVRTTAPGEWELEVPTYRVDVTREVDVVEEVLRIIGFDRVRSLERLHMPAVQRPALSAEGLRERLAAHFAARGFRGAMTPSLVNGERCVRTGAAAENELVRLRNPLSAELDVLRPSMLFGLLGAAAYNTARQQRDLAFFEQGAVYRVEGGVLERPVTALLVTGARTEESWRAGKAAWSGADLRAEVELLLVRMAVARPTVRSVEHPLLQAATAYEVDGKVVCITGQVTPAVLADRGPEQAVWYAEWDEDSVLAVLAAGDRQYVEVPRTPAVRRDLSLLLDSTVAYADLERVAHAAERQLLKAVRLFDVYEGDKLPAGKKSYALSFTLQHKEQTLTDAQVDKAMGRIRQALEKEVGAELRA